NPRWTRLPGPDEAGIRVLETYFRAYGPATVENAYRWLGVAKRRVVAWLDALQERLVAVDVDGERALLLGDDLAGLAATQATAVVRLLPGFDQWVLGPGTLDGHVVPPGRRSQVSRQAGWIAPIVVAGGVVTGTWARTDDQLTVAWFAEAGPVPRRALAEEGERLATILNRPLQPAIRTV
ncbi:MAG: DNA glycosylase AlkZ-like family protein, partial [Candidatus Limnocylindria bacterium]